MPGPLAEGRSTGAAPPSSCLRMTSVLQACPRDVPEPPSTANGRHQQQPVNLKLARGSSPRATHVTRSSCVARSVVTRTRAPGCQPSCAIADDVPVACPIGRSTPGILRSLPDNPIHRLTRRHRHAAHPCVPARCPGRAIGDPPSGSSAGWMLAMNPAPAKTPRMASLVNTATATPRTTPIPTRTVISNRWLVRSVLVIVVLPPAMARALAAISRRYVRLLRSRWRRVWLLRQGLSFLSCTMTLADWGL